MIDRTDYKNEQERGQLAFTLIELLVVTAILGIIAAVVIPTLLSAFQDEGTTNTELPVREAAAQAENKPAPLPGVPPVIETADIRVRITAKELRRGSTVHSRYTAKYIGTFVLQPTEKNKPMRLSIPLPEGAEEAEDVTLSLEGAGYSGIVDMRGVRVGIDGVHWSGTVPLAGVAGLLTAKVTFTAKGAGRVVLRLPEASGIRAVKTVVDLISMPSLPIPANSLEPKSITENSSIAGYTYTWSYKNLVSHRPIIIDLPAIESPMARVLFMLRLVGLALFLFGCGFWYLAEGYRAGGLANFRWRHFLLLGLTYSLFFAVFVVCGFRGVDTSTSLLVSALLSLPLLVWHVASIVDWRFAAKYTLPLVVFTIGVVVNGVYGGEWRSYIFLGAAAFAVAYLTFTIENLTKKQEERCQRIESALLAELTALEPMVRELTEANAEALLLLNKRNDPKLKDVRESVTNDCDEARVLLEAYRDLDRRHLGMMQRTGFDRRLDREAVAQGLWGLGETLTERLRRLGISRTDLAAKVAVLEAHDEKVRVEKKARKARTPETEVHCIACGHGWSGSPRCPNCGVRRPDELVCKKCKTVLPIPVHLFDPKGKSQLLHCPTCGQCHSGMSSDFFAGSRSV